MESLHAGKTWRVIVICEISDGAIIKYNYELYVKVINKSNIQSRTRCKSHSYINNIIALGSQIDGICVWKEHADSETLRMDVAYSFYTLVLTPQASINITTQVGNQSCRH
jgi:hypothetical protein